MFSVMSVLLFKGFGHVVHGLERGVVLKVKWFMVLWSTYLGPDPRPRTVDRYLTTDHELLTHK